MSRTVLIVGISRLLLAAIGVVSAIYCVLTFVPFTNQNLIQDGAVGWLGTFTVLQPWLYAAAIAFVVYTIRDRPGQAPSMSFVVPATLVAAFAVWVVIMAPLRFAGMEISSVWIGMSQLLPIAVVAIADLVRGLPRITFDDRAAGDDAGLLVVVVATAAAVFSASFFVAVLRVPASLLPPGDRQFIATAGFVSQLFVGMGLLLVFLTVRAAAAFAKRRMIVEIVLATVTIAGAAAWLIYAVVLRPISFDGRDAMLFAALLAVTIVLAVSGNAARWIGEREETVTSAPDFFYSGLGISSGAPPLNHWLAFGIVLFAGGLALMRMSLYDWDFLLQKLITVALWTIVSGLLFRISAVSSVRNGWTQGLVTAAVVLGLYAATVHGAKWTAAAFSAGDGSRAINVWRGYDVAFRLANDALSRGSRSTARDEFYDLLQSHTNISRAVATRPVSVNLVNDLTVTSGPKPDIFFIVIDSLRRDYLGAYNPLVTFTPRLDEFASDATVFRNSFSRYGATGLAEPSIWVGGLMLHKQYVEPFYPMNALQKLLSAEKYRLILTYDPVLDVIVRQDPSVSRMTQRGRNDLCQGLEELKERLASFAGDIRPKFAYLQPLDIHISTINREGPGIAAGESYPGFHAPTASRLKRLDGCIGGFLDHLKARGQYDSSIVVLTSDHGDVLGEQGQWGHAYTITPSVLRIPLIVKLPEKQKAAFVADPTTIAFNADLAPTIYYLLGHRDIKPTTLFGRPLFTRSLAEQTPFLGKRHYLVASSYGPVYGALSSDGRRLFIADAVNLRDTVYEMPPAAPPMERAPDEREKEQGRMFIRQTIGEIADYYRFVPGR